jgi:hypothetical protein
MKIASLLTAVFLFFWHTSPAQSAAHTSSHDTSTVREFTLAPLRVVGEVETPGTVDFASLPLVKVPVKELGLDESGKKHFRGAFFYSGYSLYDILKSFKVKKANDKEFHPSTDLYLVIENEKKQKTVLSWGEVFYAGNHFQTLISKSVEAILPSKRKTQWTLPTQSGLVCGDDLNVVRFISSPTTITVRSYSGSFAATKGDNLYSPVISITTGTETSTISEIGLSIEQRKYTSVGYGHGMGYKGVQTVEGFVLKDVLQGIVRPTADEMRSCLVVVSAKDGYRAVFSASEIFDRNDNRDFLLIDRKDSKSDGRYAVFATPDFFVDRNVKAVEKIAVVKCDSLPLADPR